jgi:ATP-dependent protease ClpP protease subunit
MKLSSLFSSSATDSKPSSIIEPESAQMSNGTKITIKQPPVLFEQTQAVIAKFEETFGAPLITYWNNSRGSVCDHDVIVFHELLENIGEQERLFLLVKSDGGSGKAALRIVNLIRQYCKELIVFVPLECASAATMIAIGADEIRMGPMAYLSAVDTSLIHELSPINHENSRVSVSLDELSRAVKLWQNENKEGINPYKHLFEYVHPLVIGAVDRAESLSIMLCNEILSHHIHDEQKALNIATVLNSKYPSHGYPILLKEAQKIGINATLMAKKEHSLLLELNELYSEMGQRATTDFDELNSHGNEILNILEANGMQIYYQQDKDWFYRLEERRWFTMNENSSWFKNQWQNGKVSKSVFHIS